MPYHDGVKIFVLLLSVQNGTQKNMLCPWELLNLQAERIEIL
jgi:hypothetical protein